MKCNMGKIDRIIRSIIGITVISTGVYLKSWWGALGLLPFITVVLAWCPVYIPFGISTRKTD